MIKILIIALALSMDTFSLSLSLSLIKEFKAFNLVLFVGLFHFLFPIIGSFFGYKILKYIPITSNCLLGIIFLILFIKLLYDFKKKNQEVNYINNIYLIILAIFVSLDSLFVGLGLSNPFPLSSIIFSIVASFFTFLGFKLGNISKNNLGKIANYLGLFLLLFLAIVHLCK